MLNQEKIRIMTKLTIYEENEGREDLKISKYHKSDYARLQAIKAFVCSTLGLLLVMALTALYRMEYLIINITKLDFWDIGKYILLFYIMISLFYIIIAITSSDKKYKNTKTGLSKYNSYLNTLRNFYSNNDKTKE